jgi:hypothetical protein
MLSGDLRFRRGKGKARAKAQKEGCHVVRGAEGS